MCGAALLRVCGTASMCIRIVRSVCPAAGCGAGRVGVILPWIGRLVGLRALSLTNALEAPHWDSRLEARSSAGSEASRASTVGEI